MVRTRRMQYQCRFCLEDDLQQNLIAPCVCTGSGRYVHSKCVYQWYTHNPSKGLTCQVCQTRLATRNSHTVEKHPFEGTLYWKMIERPAFFVNSFHWLFYCLSVVIDASSRKGLPFSNGIYMTMQVLYHIYMFYIMYWCIKSIQSKRAYWMYWYRTSRIMIPLAHCFFIAALHHQKILGGLSADICLMYYSMEHVEILDTMNRNVRIEFISTEKEQVQEQSSAESPSSSASDR